MDPDQIGVLRETAAGVLVDEPVVFAYAAIEACLDSGGTLLRQECGSPPTEVP